MAEAYSRQSALAHLNLLARAVTDPGAAGITLVERALRRQVALRGESGDPAFVQAARSVLGFDLPVAPNTTTSSGARTALWLGPSEWLLVGADEDDGEVSRLRAGLSAVRHAVVDVSDSRTIIGVAGLRARDALAKAISLDLHPRSFAPGRCAQSTLAHTSMLLHQLSEDPTRGPTYDIFVHRSVAEYAWRWLEQSASEFGVAVVCE